MDLGIDALWPCGPSVQVVSAHVGEDRLILLDVAPVIGAVESEPAQGLELALDEVGPAGVGRQVGDLDVVARGQVAKLRPRVRAGVVEDHVVGIPAAGPRGSAITSRAS